MPDVRYEELDQLAGELLPERMLLGLIDLDLKIGLFDKDCHFDKYYYFDKDC